MNLYEQTDLMLYLQEQIDNDIDNHGQVFADTLESIEMDYTDKVENIAKVIRNSEAAVEMIDNEIKRLTARKTAELNRAKWLKGYLLTSMQALGKKKEQAGIFTVSVAGNGGLAPIVYEVPEESLPDEFYETITTTRLDERKIRAYIAEGKNTDGLFHLGERGKHISIR